MFAIGGRKNLDVMLARLLLEASQDTARKEKENSQVTGQGARKSHVTGLTTGHKARKLTGRTNSGAVIKQKRQIAPSQVR